MLRLFELYCWVNMFLISWSSHQELFPSDAKLYLSHDRYVSYHLTVLMSQEVQDLKLHERSLSFESLLFKQ